MHELHRERLRTRTIENAAAVQDHELLELLLFATKPRVDTNGTAHSLLKTFGSLTNVLNATYSQLMSVKGMGRAAATHILAMREVLNRTEIIKEPVLPVPQKVFSLERLKASLMDTFSQQKNEVLIIYFLDRDLYVKNKTYIADHIVDRVEIDLKELCKMLVSEDPYYVLITHNHLSGNPSPSKNDIMTTEKICHVLTINDIKLIDHIIVSGDKVFSFFHEHLLEGINERVLATIKSTTPKWF